MYQTFTSVRGLTCRVMAIVAAVLCLGWADTWQELKATAGSVASVKADFVQEKHMQILAVPLVSRGTLLFQAPDSLRWAYTDPVESTLLLHNGKTRRFFRKDGSLTEDTSAGLQAMQLVVQQITLWLNGRFDESRAFTAKLEAGPKIVMVPRDAAVAKLIQRIEIRLSDRPAVIKSVTIFESETTFTRLDFQKVVLNEALNDGAFQMTP